MSKNIVKSLTLQGVLVAALGAAGAGGAVSADPHTAAAIDKIASAAGLLLATVGRLRQKTLHVRAPKAAAAVLALSLFVLTGCSSFIDRLKQSGVSVEASFMGASVGIGFKGTPVVEAVAQPATWTLDKTGIAPEERCPTGAACADPTKGAAPTTK